jgi:hypothetical protein
VWPTRSTGEIQTGKHARGVESECDCFDLAPRRGRDRLMRERLELLAGFAGRLSAGARAHFACLS